MATTTPNLGLTLPIGSEKVSRQILNGNFSLIDTAYGTLNSNMLWKESSSYNNAYANAKNEIMLVALYTAGNLQCALQVTIPKILISNELRYWENGDSYNGVSYHHLQVRVSETSAGDIGIYIGTDIVNDAVYKWLYR